MATPIEEAHWVLRAQCHDRDALELLLKSVQPVLRRYVTGLAALMTPTTSCRTWRWKLQLLTTAAEIAFVGVCSVLVSYHVSRMTRTVLNAIELVRK